MVSASTPRPGPPPVAPVSGHVEGHRQGHRHAGSTTTATAAVVVGRDGCSVTVGGIQRSVAATKGVTCLLGATVHGPVSVASGASLISIGSVIDGALTATGANLVTLCAPSTLAEAKLACTSGPVTVGDTLADGSPRCRPDSVKGTMSITGATGPVEVARASTTGGLDYIEGTLACRDDTVTPVDKGRPSIAARATGQCSGLATNPSSRFVQL